MHSCVYELCVCQCTWSLVWEQILVELGLHSEILTTRSRVWAIMHFGICMVSLQQHSNKQCDCMGTMHFGTPTAYEKECFTYVLKGHIAVSAAIFPTGTKGHLLDSFARSALWDSGLDYLHGTGHGVGSFLNVHEGPCGISYKTFSDEPLEAGMIVTDEPGYYEDGAFGIRIENVVLVVPVKTKYNFNNRGSLTFEPLTLVPIQTKMIDVDSLTDKECDWLNSYHQTCRDVIGKELQIQGRQEALEWLLRETEPVSKQH